MLLKHWQWLALVVLLALGMIAQRLTTFLLRSVSGLWLRRRGLVLDEGVQASSFRPLGILAAAAVWWLGLTWLALRADVLTVLLGAVKFIACWATVWTVYRAVDLLADCFASLAAKTETKVDDLLVPLARKVAKVAVTVGGLVFIVKQFTKDEPLELLAGPQAVSPLQDTALHVGETRAALRRMALGESGSWGYPTGVALSADGTHAYVGQRERRRAAPAQERILELDLCS